VNAKDAGKKSGMSMWHIIQLGVIWLSGSECINHLTIEDKMLCEDSLRIYKQAASFVDNLPAE
jgi:hypothetical protein